MKKIAAIGLALAMISGSASTAQNPEVAPTSSVNLPHAWPRPNAVNLIDNDRGAMWNADFPQGVASRWHRHLYEFVGVELTTSSYEVIDPDGTWRTIARPRGYMWVLPKGLTHMERGLTNPGRNILVVDLKEGPSPAYKADGKSFAGFAGAKANLVNDTARFLQWDVSWSPTIPEKQTFHSRDIFIAIVDGGTLRTTEAGKKPETIPLKSGQGIFLKGGVVRKIEAAEGQMRAMLIELK